MAVRVVVHGHFYQPPRENPWTGEIDEQPSAAPFHDWNERIHDECYRPNTEVAITTPTGDATVNNLERMSFNFGPTLLQWIESAHPETYSAILAADRASVTRLGHGNAIAQAFHHTILPLASPRDARTQVRWGLVDFRHRFGREAKGMWLPETAASNSVLGALIDEGLSFTILAQHQADRWRDEDGGWHDAEVEPIDPRYPYRYLHPDGSGRSLTLFLYDSQIAKAIAFENAASSADRFMEMFVAAGDSPDQVVHAATDGETYGHHHTFADIGLGHALFVEAERLNALATNYARHLDDFPPQREAELSPHKASSWSCHHGVERWRSDCGCSTGGDPGWNQAWRTPLRNGLELLRSAADAAYERLGRDVLKDPWGARDRYVDVAIGARSLDEFCRAEARGRPDPDRIELLLELQRNVMSTFTSCGWFFNDVGGIETVQVLRYAARALELMDRLGVEAPATQLMQVLRLARSNDPARGTGADILAGAMRQRDRAMES